jgi:hypothetical protein
VKVCVGDMGESDTATKSSKLMEMEMMRLDGYGDAPLTSRRVALRR